MRRTESESVHRTPHRHERVFELSIPFEPYGIPVDENSKVPKRIIEGLKVTTTAVDVSGPGYVANRRMEPSPDGLEALRGRREIVGQAKVCDLESYRDRLADSAAQRINSTDRVCAWSKS